MKSLSLKNTLTFNFVLVAALPLILIAFWGLYNLSDNMEREITNKNSLLAKSIAAELEILLEDPLLHLKQIKALMESRNIVSPDELNGYLASLIEVEQNFDMLKVLDRKGIITHLAPFDINILGLDMSNQEYYQSARNTSKPVWSKTFISSQTGTPTLTLTLPLKQGFLVGHLNLSHLNKIADRTQLGSLGNTIITDNNGVVIAHPDQALVSERFNAKHLYHIQQGLTGVEGTFTFIEGVEKIGSVAIVPQTGWLVAISQSVEEAFESITKLRNFIYCSILIVIIIAVFIALINLHRILHPLTQFVEETKRIAGGDYSYKLPQASYRELRTLGNSFKTMTDAVKSREDTLRDEITERKQAQEKIKQQQYYLEKAQELGQIGTWELDIIHNKLYWTDENCRIFGVPVGSLVNYEIFIEKVHPDDREYVGREWQDAMNGKVYDIEHRIVISGETKWVREKADVIFDAQGNAVSATGFTQEITEHKLAEKEKETLESHLQQAHKLEAIGTMAGGIAHDFNNLLSVITGNTEIIQRRNKSGKSIDKNIEYLKDATYRATNLTKQILSFSRQEKTETAVVDLSIVVSGSLKLLRSTIPASVEIINRSPDKSFFINGNTTQLQQVLMNLCTNAVYAMKDKGLLAVKLEEVSSLEEKVSVGTKLQNCKYIRLSVSDTGFGMDKETINRIFDPFFTTKDVGQGTGMGLSTIHGIVEQYGGFITVDSVVGQGTTFNIYFLESAKGERSSQIDEIESLPTGTENILFVDDEELIVLSYSSLLEDQGYNVTSVTSSSEALEIFKTNSKKFDLVFTDQTMPGMSGVELAVELLKIRSDIPIVLCTGFTSNITKKKAQALGIREFCMKPLGIEQLATVARRVLDEETTL